MDVPITFHESGAMVPPTGGTSLDVAADAVLSWRTSQYPDFAFSGENKRLVWASEPDASTKQALFVSVLEEKTGE